MRRRLIAVLYGAVCHFLFAAAVLLMGRAIYSGMCASVLPIGGIQGRMLNALLLLQFPILHSFFLTESGRTLIMKLAPADLGSDLSSTVFATIASLQLIFVFVLWTPPQTVIYAPHGVMLGIWSAIFVLSWIFLLKALIDAGLSLQSGFLGWSAVARGEKPHYAGFPRKGLYRLCRQPVYLGFFLVLLSGPIWTADHLLICFMWGLYCIFGPLLKETRLIRRYGDSYRRYCRQVPYFIPKQITPRRRHSRIY